MKILEMEQGSPEWHKARVGTVSGSNLKNVMGTKAAYEKFKNEIIAERITERRKETRSSEEMQRGTAEEPFTRADYIKKSGKKVEEFGLCISEEIVGAVLSPDGLNKIFTHGAEFKNPDTKKHIEYVRLGTGIKDYKWQLVHYYVVIPTLKTLDFVTDDSRIALDSLRTHITPTKRSDYEEDIKNAKEKLKTFFEEVEEEIQKLTF